MASGPITSWQIDGEIVETVADFIFLGSTITADADCSHEIKRRLLLRRKVMTNLDGIFREGDGIPFQDSCLENPMDSSPPGPPIPGILQARTWEWLPFPSPVHESERGE